MNFFQEFRTETKLLLVVILAAVVLVVGIWSILDFHPWILIVVILLSVFLLSLFIIRKYLKLSLISSSLLSLAVCLLFFISSWIILVNIGDRFFRWEFFDYHPSSTMQQQESIPVQEPKQATEPPTWQSYRNDEFGFEVALPDSWQGYSIITESWKGRMLDGTSQELQGPRVVIRNPKWIEAQHYQDIPILVFTKEEWQLIEAMLLSVSAASIGPGKLGENQQYVFALPPRWVGFTDALGQDEARDIVKTFKAFDLTAGWQTYRNDEFGFEVKVPSSFQDFGNGGFRNNSVGDLGISVMKTEKSLQDYVDERVAPENNIFEGNVILTVRERKEVEINGEKGVWLDTYVGNGLAAPVLETYISTPGNYLVHIRMIWFDGELDHEEMVKNVFNQILSTFRFVE